MKRPLVLRRTVIAALLAWPLIHVLVPPARAEEAETVSAEALSPGSWSAQFAVEPNLTLGSYLGSTLSLKRHLRSGNALRFGLSLNLGTTSGDSREVSGDTLFTSTRANVVDGNDWSIGLTTYYLWYARRAAPLHAYGGVGPTVSWSRGHENRLATDIFARIGQPSDIRTSTTSEKTRRWGAGIATAAGIEWLVARRMGLFAEYASSLSYGATERTNQFTDILSNGSPRFGSSHSASHGWNFSGSGGRLGVSAYY